MTKADGLTPATAMDFEKNKKWLPFAILAVALLVWAGVFAAGAYLEPSADAPVHDIRKPLIILGTMAAFLAFWGIALWRRAKRK
jgi:membrane protein DedA with SNARE-associated domain